VTSPMKMTIPLEPTGYFSNPQLNDITVSTSREVTMMLLSNETENQKIVYSDGWYDEEKNNYGSWRWMANHSTLWVHSDTGQEKTIQFDGLSFGTCRNLTIRGDRYSQVYRLSPEHYTSIRASLLLQPGYTPLQFDVPEGCAIPSASIGLNNSDTRCLSISVRNITIS